MVVTRSAVVAVAVLGLSLIAGATAAGEAADFKTGTVPDEKMMKSQEMEMQRIYEAERAGINGFLETLRTKVAFPGRSDLTFPVGEVSTVGLGVRVTKNKQAKCTGAVLRLAAPTDSSMVVSIFPSNVHNTKLTSDVDATYTIPISPDKQLHSRDLLMMITLECKVPEAKDAFGYTVFNQTVHLVDLSSDFDFELLFLLLIFGALSFGVFYLNKVDKPKPASKGKATKVETGTSETTDKEWLEGTFHPDAKKKAT